MRFRCGTIITATLAILSVPSFSQQAPPMLHDGTPVYLSMERTVSSQSDQAGEVVEFLLKQDLVAGNTVVLAAGTEVDGKVIASRINDRSGAPGMLEFRIESLALANGQQIPLRTIKQLPTDANADITPEKLTNLVNSPYAPFAHFNNGSETTVPKNSPLTLYVAADVTIGNQNAVARPLSNETADTLAAHIIDRNSGAKSLGDIAREERERGKISGGMISSAQQ